MPLELVLGHVHAQSRLAGDEFVELEGVVIVDRAVLYPPPSAVPGVPPLPPSLERMESVPIDALVTLAKS